MKAIVSVALLIGATNLGAIQREPVRTASPPLVDVLSKPVTGVQVAQAVKAPTKAALPAVQPTPQPPVQPLPDPASQTGARSLTPNAPVADTPQAQVLVVRRGANGGCSASGCGGGYSGGRGGRFFGRRYRR